jgi:flotillin
VTELVLIIAAGIVAALAVIVFAIWANQYTKVGPNEVLIISGAPRRKLTGSKGPGYRIVRGGGTFVIPFRERVQRLSLELMQFDVRTSDTYTQHGVAVAVDGVCMVKVSGSDTGIERASEQFLSRGRDDIVRTALQTVEGHMRAAIGGHSIEEIYRERKRIVDAVRELSEPDLERMGIEIVSLTLRNVSDNQGYLEALGRPRIAEVKRDAIRGEAEAEREAKASRYSADLAIEASRRDYETQRASYKAEGQRATAQADLSYQLQQAITRQQVRAEELQVEIVERQKQIEVMQAEVERRKRELESDTVEPALAKAREIISLAEAYREEKAAIGQGEADANRLKGLAEAEAMGAKARSWNEYNEAAITDRVLEVLPEIASAVSAPLSQTDKIVMIGQNGGSPGAANLTGDVTKVVAELPAIIEALTGMSLDDVVKRIPNVGNGQSGESPTDKEG